MEMYKQNIIQNSFALNENTKNSPTNPNTLIPTPKLKIQWFFSHWHE